MIGLTIYCFGIAFGIIMASWILDFLENRYNNSWQKRVTAEDLEELGRLLRE